jgi:hypothetical protein
MISVRRYQLEGNPNDVAPCHCEGCRKSSGAPVMAWADYHDDRLTVTKGALKVINSSGKSIGTFARSDSRAVSHAGRRHRWIDSPNTLTTMT